MSVHKGQIEGGAQGTNRTNRVRVPADRQAPRHDGIERLVPTLARQRRAPTDSPHHQTPPVRPRRCAPPVGRVHPARRGLPGHPFTNEDARFDARDATRTTGANARTHRSANVVVRPYNIHTDVRQQRRPGKNKALRSTALHCIAQSARTKRALATTNRVPPGLSRRPQEA